MRRYDRNKNMISETEQKLLEHKSVCIVGCGGLGGYSIELLARLGVGCLTVIDGDIFDESNFNRQLLSEERLLGYSKAEAAKERVLSINSQVKVNVQSKFLTKENAKDLLAGHNVVVDALDSITTRKILASACDHLKIPLVHGAIAGWYGQVATVLPGDGLIEKIYQNDDAKGREKELGNPSFTPAAISAIQVSEVLKLLLYPEKSMRNTLLYIDLMTHTFEKISFE